MQGVTSSSGGGPEGVGQALSGGESGGFMIGKKKMEISEDKIAKAKAIMDRFKNDLDDGEEDPASYLKKSFPGTAAQV